MSPLRRLLARRLLAIAVTGLLATGAMIGPVSAATAETAGTDVLADAKALYGADVSVSETTNAAFDAAFPGFQLYIVLEASRIPLEVHMMAYSSTTGGIDVTEGFNDLLASRAPILTASEALDVGISFAELANTEIQPNREAVGSADSARLGVTIADPSVRALLDGWQVKVSTWSEENGVVIDWTLELGLQSIVYGHGRVKAVATGAFDATLEAFDLPAGTWMRNRYASGHELTAWRETSDGLVQLAMEDEVVAGAYTPVTTRTNYDGSTWLVYFPEEFTPSSSHLELGSALGDGGLAAYNEQVLRNPGLVGASACDVENPATNWGFVSKDPNCVLEVHVYHPLSLFCGACIITGYDVHIFISPDIERIVRNYGWYQGVDIYGIARVIMGHEHFHNLQYAANQWSPYDLAWLEGMARFSQTPFDPEVEFRPSSLFYAHGGNGANGFMARPQWNMCDHSYSYAIYWGYLYAVDGGIETIQRIVDAIDTAAGSGCDEWLANAVTTVLADAPGAHDSHAEAIRDFAVAVYRKDFEWGTVHGTDVKQWGTHLRDPGQSTLTSGTGSYWTGAWGMKYVNVPTAPGTTVDCSADAGFDTRVFLVGTDGTFAIETLSCGTTWTVPEGSFDRVVVNGVRLATSAGWLGVTVG